MPSDDENDHGETYEIKSDTGNVWTSDTTLAEIIFEARSLSRKRKVSLDELRTVIEDAWSLVAVNEGMRADDTLDEWGDELPAGWSNDVGSSAEDE